MNLSVYLSYAMGYVFAFGGWLLGFWFTNFNTRASAIGMPEWSPIQNWALVALLILVIFVGGSLYLRGFFSQHKLLIVVSGLVLGVVSFLLINGWTGYIGVPPVGN